MATPVLYTLYHIPDVTIPMSGPYYRALSSCGWPSIDIAHGPATDESSTHVSPGSFNRRRVAIVIGPVRYKRKEMVHNFAEV
jgi:hypothetical protein